MSNLTRACLATAGAILAHVTVDATPVHAQLGVPENLVSNVTDVAVSYGRTRVAGELPESSERE